MYLTPSLDCKFGATGIINYEQLFQTIKELCELKQYWDVEDLGRFLAQTSLKHSESIALRSIEQNDEYEDKQIVVTGSVNGQAESNYPNGGGPLYYEFPRLSTVDSFNNTADFDGVIFAPQYNTNIRTPDIYPKFIEDNADRQQLNCVPPLVGNW